ncbi:MAG TPA: hypothetical protein VK851_13570, partial [Anaerolineales bacterium]|nr:hypothetical protein [Anaerolineales bacterium]
MHKIKAKPILICLIIMVVNVFLFGCTNTTPTPTATPSPEQMDKSMFTGIPCAAPCWYGLELNESTKEDVLTVLHKLTFISQNTIRETTVGYWDPILKENTQANLISANCAQPKDRQCIGLTIADDKLKIIGLFPNQEIRFESLVNQLGNPDYVTANLIPPVHSPGCSVSLIWVNRQIVADHTEKSNDTLCDELRSG